MRAIPSEPAIFPASAYWLSGSTSWLRNVARVVLKRPQLKPYQVSFPLVPAPFQRSLLSCCLHCITDYNGALPYPHLPSQSDSGIPRSARPNAQAAVMLPQHGKHYAAVFITAPVAAAVRATTFVEENAGRRPYPHQVICRAAGLVLTALT